MNVSVIKKASMPPCKKSNTGTASLVWDANSEAGLALTKGVMEGTIKKNVPARIVKESNLRLWKPYDTAAIRNALKRAFAAKEKLEQEQKAKDDRRAGQACEKMRGTTAKNGKCFCIYIVCCKCQVLTCIVEVVCDEFPDLDDASFVLGQDKAKDATESEEEEVQEVCLKMPAVAKTPNKPAMPEKPLRQSTLTQTMSNFYMDPTIVLLVAASMPVPEEQQLLPRSFMPPYFITRYPTGPVTRPVGVVINLPGGVASHDINDVAVSLDEDSKELIVRVKLHPYMTGLKFFGQLGKAIGPSGGKKYDTKHLSIFHLHLQMYQA